MLMPVTQKLSRFVGVFFCLSGLLVPLLAFSQNKAPQVVVHKVEEQKWSDTVEALGTLIANETVQLTATVTDTITRIHFEDGQRVEAGFVLAEMTDQEESALVAEMTARVDEAKRQLTRLKTLPESGAVSESLFDQRTREYEAAAAQLNAMKSRLQDRLIVAPFDGVLGLRNISAGALVEPGTEIVTLTDDSVMKLDFSIPAIYLGLLRTEVPIEARTRAFPDRTFKGTVKSIDSRVDPITRSVIVRAILPNDFLEDGQAVLKPGLLMTVRLEYNERVALVVPEEALIPKGSSNTVFVVDENTLIAEKRDVVIGTRRRGHVEILSGVNEGEVVITHGTMNARTNEGVVISAYQRSDESSAQVLKRMEQKS
ncbi:efflux RND transporter periplasmic adaptor subunit [bacterium]|nr:efflux RND transporter periplasmic adaptor subunit [bacterium]